MGSQGGESGASGEIGESGEIDKDPFGHSAWFGLTWVGGGGLRRCKFKPQEEETFNTDEYFFFLSKFPLIPSFQPPPTTLSAIPGIEQKHIGEFRIPASSHARRVFPWLGTTKREERNGKNGWVKKMRLLFECWFHFVRSKKKKK